MVRVRPLRRRCGMYDAVTRRLSFVAPWFSARSPGQARGLAAAATSAGGRFGLAGSLLPLSEYCPRSSASDL